MRRKREQIGLCLNANWYNGIWIHFRTPWFISGW
jgi:hypothetical protein